MLSHSTVLILSLHEGVVSLPIGQRGCQSESSVY